MQKLNNGSDVLLFGCSGLLGQYIIYEFNKEKINYFSFSRKKPNYVKHNKWDKFYLEEKINKKNLNKIKLAKFIILNAALKPKLNRNFKNSDFVKCNINFVNQILKLQKRYRYKVIYISSTLTNKFLFDRNKLSMQNILYLKSKIKAENLIKQKSIKKKYLIIKTTSIYGYGLGKDKFLNKLCKAKDLKSKNDNNQIFNFIHAYDIARFIVSSIKKKNNGIRYLIGDYISFEQICDLINNKKYRYANNNEKKNSFFYTKKKSKFKRKIDLKKGINLLKNNKFI